jgi:Fic family protein
MVTNNLDIVDSLLQELKQLQPINPENKRKLDKKFRLEFNYNSNHIEGNTLTYGETELLLIFDDTRGSHTMREYEEMKAHDVAYQLIEEWAKDTERPLTEQNIKNLNEIILVRPFWKDAITPDGQQTRRLIKVGSYKEYPNSVRLANGEIFDYASPTETPILMNELIEWYRDEESGLHPVTLATMLHYKFVRIHPFDDGNGRVSRLLMNFILLKNGFPPVIIKSKDKTNYLNALHDADTGNYETLINYIAEQLIWSLQISIKAIKGENIDEPDDLDKKLALLEKELEAEDADNELQTHLSTRVMNQHFNDWIFQLLEKLIITTNKFSKYYLSYRHSIETRIGADSRSFIVEEEDPLGKFITFWKDWSLLPPAIEYKAEINLYIHFEGFRKGGINSFGCNYTFKISFEQYTYEILKSHFDESNNTQNLKQFTKKLLHKPITQGEMEEINKQWGDLLLKHMEYYWKKQKEKDLF